MRVFCIHEVSGALNCFRFGENPLNKRVHLSNFLKVLFLKLKMEVRKNL
jgi:hypothetical protein